MLWAAVHLPDLPLEVFLRGKSSTDTTDTPEITLQAHHILVANAAARGRGVHAGMAIAAAYALAPELIAHARDPAREAEALEAAAMWASRFTPSVSLETEGLLLEIEPSLKLFGGMETILTALDHGIRGLGFDPRIACAPTARAAWWLARAGRAARIEDPAMLRSALDNLPLAATDCMPQALATFESIGVRTVGAALALPRAGFARRFGPELVQALDRALGRAPEPRRLFVPPARFRARLELPAAVEHAEALQFATRRLLIQLCGYLAGRASGVPHFDLVLEHDEPPVTTLRIGLAAPARDETHFALLLRERLGVTRLRAPVYTIALAADEVVPLAGVPLTLFDDALAASGEWRKLVERLRARLGASAVHGLLVAADHRPEYATRAADPGTKSPAASFGLRPLWLLQTPQRLLETGDIPHHKGPLTLLAGPERIESGWWDGGDVGRDYFIAEDTDRALLWIYRERRRLAGWFLHGVFA